MIKKVLLVIYYTIFYNLPHSRFVGFTSTLRVWYLSKVLKIMPFDKRSKVEFHVYISNSKGIFIGKNCRINENVFIQEATIGDNVLIAPNTAILSVSHIHNRLDVPIVDQGESIPNPPIIEDNVWIARNVVIMPGVRIGKGSIVGAGAVVTKDVEPLSVVGGVPARLIRYRS